MRRLALLFCLGVVLLPLVTLPAQGEAATLHAIIVGDTYDSIIGPGVVRNIELIHSEVVRIAYHARLNLSELILSEDDYHPMSVLQAIQDLKTDPDDVVLYYQSSHGYRTEELAGIWPALFFGWNEWALRLDDVNEILRGKPQRLTLILADVCNNCVKWEDAPTIFRMAPGIESMGLSKRYQKLFVESRGTIIASAAKPGQIAWIDIEQGSLFTLSFLKAIQKGSSAKKTDWNAVLSSTQAHTLNWSQSIEGITAQEPQFILELR